MKIIYALSLLGCKVCTKISVFQGTKIPKSSEIRIRIKLTSLSNVDWVNARSGLKKSSKIATIYENTIEGRPHEKSVCSN